VTDYLKWLYKNNSNQKFKDNFEKALIDILEYELNIDIPDFQNSGLKIKEYSWYYNNLFFLMYLIHDI
jgi:hypothetical protein